MNLKDQFKKVYTEEPMEWDKEELWGDIEKELPPVEKKKRRFFIWWFAGLFAIAMTLFVNLKHNSGQISEVVNDKKSEEITKSEIIPTQEAQEKRINPATNAPAEEIDLSNEASHKINATSKRNDVKFNDATISTTRQNSNNQDGNNVIRTTPESKSSNKEIASRNNQYTQIENNGQSLSKINISLNANSTTNSTGMLADTLKRDVIKIPTLKNIDAIPGWVIYNSNKKKRRSLWNYIRIDKYSQKKSNPTKFFELAIALSAGPTIGSTSTTNSNQQNYVEMLQASKDLQETIGANIMLRRNLSTHWKLGLGINYRRSFEWFNYVQQEESIQEIPTDNAQYYIANGQQIPVPGTLEETTTTQSLVKTPVKRNYIDLNIELGYMLHLNKSNLYPYLSLNPNVFYRYKGTSLDVNQKILQAGDERQAPIYKNSNVHSFSYGIDWNKGLNERLQLSIGLRSTHNVSSSISLDDSINERHSDFRMRVGLIYGL